MMSDDSSTTALDVIASFEALNTSKARRAAYRGILELLTINEWREVKEQAELKLLTRDILGSLPVELVARICQLLDLADIVALQSVSRRWYELLSSPVIYRTTLRLHGIHGPYDRSSDEEIRSIFVRYAKKRVRLELGRAHRKAFYRARLYSLGHENVIAYCNARLAWADKDEHGGPLGVAVICLLSGKLSRFFIEDRGVPFHVRLSDTAVAMTTWRGDCYVANFTTSEQGLFRLPSATVYDFTISADRVAVVSGNNHLYFYDLRSKVTRETQLKFLPLLMALHPTENDITTIHCEHQGVACAPYDSIVDALVVTRHSVTGTTISSFPPTVLRPFSNGAWNSESFSRINSTSCPMGVLNISPENNTYETSLMWISYEPSTSKLSVRYTNPRANATFRWIFRNREATAVSNDLIYYICPGREGAETDTGPYILDLATTVVREAKDISVTGSARHLEKKEEGDSNSLDEDTLTFGLEEHMKDIICTFGDSSFFGWATDLGFKIWCLDENIDMPWGEDIRTSEYVSLLENVETESSESEGSED